MFLKVSELDRKQITLKKENDINYFNFILIIRE